jgi:hypothetical protein
VQIVHRSLGIRKLKSLDGHEFILGHGPGPPLPLLACDAELRIYWVFHA